MMLSTTTCEPGTVLIVRFPFTDLETHKKRPAVIVSPASYTERHGDIVIVPLTSVPQRNEALFLKCWEKAGLLKPSWVKPMVGTISVSIVERVMGRLDGTGIDCVRYALGLLFHECVWPPPCTRRFLGALLREERCRSPRVARLLSPHSKKWDS